MNSFEQQLSPDEKIVRGIPLTAAEQGLLYDREYAIHHEYLINKELIRAAFNFLLERVAFQVMLQSENHQKDLRSQQQTPVKPPLQNSVPAFMSLAITFALSFEIVKAIHHQLFQNMHTGILNLLGNQVVIQGHVLNTPQSTPILPITADQYLEQKPEIKKTIIEAAPDQQQQIVEQEAEALTYLQTGPLYNYNLISDYRQTNPQYQFSPSMIEDLRDLIQSKKEIYFRNNPDVLLKLYQAQIFCIGKSCNLQNIIMPSNLPKNFINRLAMQSDPREISHLINNDYDNDGKLLYKTPKLTRNSHS